MARSWTSWALAAAGLATQTAGVLALFRWMGDEPAVWALFLPPVAFLPTLLLGRRPVARDARAPAIRPRHDGFDAELAGPQVHHDVGRAVLASLLAGVAALVVLLGMAQLASPVSAGFAAWVTATFLGLCLALPWGVALVLVDGVGWAVAELRRTRAVALHGRLLTTRNGRFVWGHEGTQTSLRRGLYDARLLLSGPGQRLVIRGRHRELAWLQTQLRGLAVAGSDLDVPASLQRLVRSAP